VNHVPVFGRRVDGCRYVIRPSAYALARNGDGEFAVVRTPSGCFLPGGGIEMGESAEQTVEREAKEECGLVLKSRAQVGEAIEIVYSAEERTCFEKRCVFVEADVVRHETSMEADHELYWIDVGHLLDSLSHESHRWAVRRLTRLP
jgi:8-oxo-dGTP diphosphatase